MGFFAVGFLAASFERAAGLGHVERGQARVAHVGSKAGAASAPDAVAVALAVAVAAHVERRAEPPAGAGAPHPELRPVSFGARRPLSLPAREDHTPVPSPRFASLPSAGPALHAPAIPAALPPGVGEQPRPQRDPPEAAAHEFILPFERGRVTSMFNQGRYHPAIDLAGRLGSPVHATTRSQRVIFTGRRGGYGNLVVTRDSLGRQHFYAHLQRITARPGSVLEQGQVLGLLGSTGRSTGPHVHYEVRLRSGRHLDPATLLFAGRRVSRGFAWNGSRSLTRVAATRTGNQPRPR
jgi:murein DD-endopeptidase MepM/ murein hydrolase activator NlpD